LSVFIDLRSADCVCLYYSLRVWSQTNKLIKIILFKTNKCYHGGPPC